MPHKNDEDNKPGRIIISGLMGHAISYVSLIIGESSPDNLIRLCMAQQLLTLQTTVS